MVRALMADGETSRDEELTPGTVCDGYRIVELIAAGGMGDVYEAVHEVTGKMVAVKCLKVRHRNKEDARARMKMEAVVLAELQHANLVQVYDAGVHDSGMVWIAMERLHGQTLREILHRGGALSIPDALYYASEIADGVDAVHEVNVIHRDLKPENVFVTTRKVVKVLDLGTGKFTGYGINSTDRMRVVGTTAYMSPEQIKGLRVDARADVYALALMVYEMIAGRHPLAQDDGIAGLPREIEQIALMQLQMTPKPLADLAPHCPAYIAAIVTKALAKDREQRYVNMTAFSRELRTARKRFIAENGLDDSPVDLLAGGDRLREKFGAPPRQSSKPPPPPARSARDVDTAVDRGVAAVDSLKTEIQERPDFTAGGLTPVPAAYVPTVDLSSSALPAMPPDVARGSDLTNRALSHDDVRNRTTHTNPLLAARAADLTPEPLALPEVKRRSICGFVGAPDDSASGGYAGARGDDRNSAGGDWSRVVAASRTGGAGAGGWVCGVGGGCGG